MAFRVVGIDPGLIRTGVIVMDEDMHTKCFATFKADKSQYTDGHRVHCLAEEITMWVRANIPGSVTVRLGIETPVYNNNAAGFGKQWRTVQAIIDALRPDFVVEVSPTTLKRIATGDGRASKADMVAASDWDYDCMGQADVEALADARGAAMACFEKRPGTVYVMPPEEDAAHVGPVMEGYRDD